MFKYLLIILCALSSFSLYSQQELLPVFKNGKWGVVDTNLNMITNYQYSNLFIVKDKYICAKEKGYFGLLDKGQNLVLPLNMSKLRIRRALFLLSERMVCGELKN
ncbi:MAG: hypothetical protein HC831_14420, partial [Chloroflexia bacterium]|nr:hypothetical protein [Chloroflexia bacterium]